MASLEILCGIMYYLVVLYILQLPALCLWDKYMCISMCISAFMEESCFFFLLLFSFSLFGMSYYEMFVFVLILFYCILLLFAICQFVF